MNSRMDYELFSRKVADRDYTRLCRFCLAEDTKQRSDTKKIAQLYKQITNEELSLSSEYPTFICFRCDKNLRTAAKIRCDIIHIEKYWKQYVDEIPVITEIKIEDEDDENGIFETVEMIIEPVEPINSSGFDGDGEVDYLDMDMKPAFGTKFESCNYDDDDSFDNYDSINDLNDTGDSESQAAMTSSDKVNCQHCDSTELTPVELQIHQQKYHPEICDAPQFICDICQVRYSSRYGIRTHMKRHMQTMTSGVERIKRIKRYQCSTCDERFNKKVMLVEHELRRHSGAALHVCHICGIGKKTKSLMNNHLKTHNPDYVSKRTSSKRPKPKNSKRYYTCWMCPTRVDFNTLDELKVHRKNLHHDFQCKFCKNGFMTNEALQSHMLIHGTQDRPHLCKYCGGTFAKIGHLKSHIQGKHAEKKPYPCQKCPKGFVHRYQLQSHIRISHDKIKAFQCTECPTSFGHSKSRVWHMRTVHKM